MKGFLTFQMRAPRRSQTAFTLVELLVVIAIIGVLVAILLPALNTVRSSARRMQCAGRMRQIGIGLQAYAETRRGRLPEVTGHGEAMDESWIFKLAPYLEYVDAVRVCPDDPEASFRLENNLTSYVLNGFLAEISDLEEEEHEHEEEEHAHEEEEGEEEHGHEHEGHDHEHADGRYSNLNRLKSSATTILLFEAAAGAHVDHVDSFEWFIDEHIDAGSVFDAVASEVAVDRHGGATANYMFADGHVESIAEATIRQWCMKGDQHENFVLPRD